MTSDQQESDLNNTEEDAVPDTVVPDSVIVPDSVNSNTVLQNSVAQVLSPFHSQFQVQKTGTGLNPNADTFFYTKTLTPSSVDKGWEPGEEFLTNGDLKQDEVGGGFSSGDSLVSDSSPAPTVDTALDTGAPPPEFVPDPMVGLSAAIPMVVGAEAATSVAGEEGAMAAEQGVDMSLSTVALSPVIQAPMANGFGPGQPHQDSQEGGAQAPEASSQPDNPADISKLLLAQLEYYFSRPNLMQDHYLQSQMDGDQYVPISTIANFNQVVKLTRDYDLIVEILRSSKIVQVDETGTKVRPKHNRSVLMLREIPDTTQKAEVEALFQSEKCPKLTSCEFAHNGYWYITFSTDEDAREAYLYLRANEIKFQGKPVLARIKAKPLVRAGGGAQFPPNKNPSRQQQQDPAVPYLRQQQAQYPVLTPMSQFAHQQQVPQAVSPFLYNFQPMMPQWGTHSTAAPTFLDPGAMLAMNGYQATSIKPSTNHTRNIYSVRNNNNRGMTKPHHRPQSVTSDKMPDSRPMDRPHASSLSSARASPRNSNQHAPESHAQPPPFPRSRSEGSTGAGNGHFSSQLHGAVSAAPTPLVPEESGPHHAPAQATPSSKPDSISASVQPKKHYSDSRRGGNYRRSRRNDEGAKNSRSNPSHGGKEGKPHEPHFELEATSFPPLPGSTNNSSSSDAPEGNKLSDVVKGTARPHTRFEEKVKATPAPPSAVAATPVAAAASAPAAAPVSNADSAPASQMTSTTNTATPLTAAAVVSAVAASPVAKETEVSASPSPASHTTAPASATAVEPSAHPSKTSKTSGHPVSSAAVKPVSETPVAPKQATVSTAPAKQTSAPAPAPTSTPAAEVAPAKLSYAQMVARKQQAENAAKQNCEEGAQAAARPATQTTLREQSQTQASASVPASAPPKSASASARPSAKEPPRKDFEPKEQRLQGSRRAKENRDSRQPRFDRRRSDRDVKVPAK